MMEWVSALQLVLPELLQELAPISKDTPEDTSLPLPSRFTDEGRRFYNLQEATRIELLYRIIQAHALLTECRMLVFDSEHGYQLKTRVTGQQKTTRMRRLTNDINHEKASARSLYNYIRKTMLTMCSPQEIYMFKELTKEDLYCKVLQQAVKGYDGKLDATGKPKMTSWIWQVVKPEGMGEDEEEEWQVESECGSCRPTSC